jgi:flagellar biosynthesis protein FliQ
VEQTQVVGLMTDAIHTIMLVALPLLLTAMVIGIVISIFQAATQISEQTLSFVPKIIGIMVAILIFGGWMLSTLTDFATRVFSYINVVVK